MTTVLPPPLPRQESSPGGNSSAAARGSTFSGYLTRWGGTYQPPPISWASAPGSCLIRLMNIIWRIRRPEDPRSRCTVSEARWRTDSLHNNFSYKNNVLRKPNPVGFHSTYFIISGFRCPELPAVLHLIAYGKLSQSPAQFP